MHKALDQLGAFAGPLLAAALLAATGVMWPPLAALAFPGAAAMGLLLWMRRRVPSPDGVECEAAPTMQSPHRSRRTVGGWLGVDLPRPFLWFAGSAAAATADLVTFGLISYHASQTTLITVAAAPILYAAALAALASGHLHDQ
ncbi:hypothetical protein ACPSM1_19040 [Micromonospora chersina]|uniref:hypothetical protein n=1 Tax=Micromonospora chersina TaxID=47854 RepID=UPI003C900417